ncbi:MAG TPA: hypothetical protein VGJ30_18645, partial [Candidatus Angelobacter sp.]
MPAVPLKFLPKTPNIYYQDTYKQATEINFMELPMSQLGQGPAARRWSRHKIDVRLKVSFPNDGKNDSAFGRANSLSRGGIGAYIP